MLYKQEEALMAKYGLSYDDVESEDWRAIFDEESYRVVELVKRQVGVENFRRFMGDLYRFEAKKQKLYDLYMQSLTLLDVDEHSMSAVKLRNLLETL